MSHHHIQLPPITYVPLPKPKKIDKRRRRTQIGSSGEIKDTDDASPIEDPIGLGHPPAAYSPLPGECPQIDGSERRSKRQSGLLSQGMLKTMLLAQEKLK
jgi:hypothetical protein